MTHKKPVNINVENDIIAKHIEKQFVNLKHTKYNNNEIPFKNNKPNDIIVKYSNIFVIRCYSVTLNMDIKIEIAKYVGIITKIKVTKNA